MPVNKESGVLTTDEVVVKIGQFGRFQKLLDAALFVLNLPVAYQILISYFVTFTSSWKCKENSECLQKLNLHALNMTMAWTDRRRCSIPRTEWYYTEPKEYSMSIEFGLDCDREWIASLLSSVYFIGWAVGGVVIGIVGDKFGRKFIIFPSVAFTVVLGFLTAFLKNVYYIMICRFIIGFFNSGATLQSFILMSEYVGAKYRSLAGIIIYATFPIGYILVAVQAYLTQNWRILYIVCTAPYIFTMFFYKFVPESIKWLVVHGNEASVRATFVRAAIWNKKEVQADVKVVNPKEEEGSANEKSSFSVLFQTRRLLVVTLVQGVVWVATGLAYFGLSLVADDLGGTLYRDFILLSIMELPAFPTAIFLSNKCGRKVATLFPLLAGGVCSCIVVAIPLGHHLKDLRIVVGILGKFFLSVTFDAVYTWTLEMYPIPVRSTGMGILQTVSHLGSGCAPWIAKGLRHLANWLPYVAMGIPAIMAAVVGLYLPETLTKKEGNKIGFSKTWKKTETDKREEIIVDMEAARSNVTFDSP